ncbi:Protein kinase domain-containing protein [Aphelenchoides bicaudatus]|nr:Protein kinase domain-containing protein [Aphelenchoides bicaudatus]
MFSLASESDEASTYHTYSPTPVSEYGGDSRSGSQSPGLSEAASTSAPAPSLRSTKNPRKRRAQLSPINLANPAPHVETDESNDSPTNSGSAPGSDEESNGHKSRAISDLNDPLDKRIRLTSSSSNASTASLLSLGSTYGSQQSLTSIDSCFDPSDLDNSVPPSVKAIPALRNGRLIADGEFELVGSGQECQAVHIPSKTVHHCMAINLDDYNTFMAVFERIESAKNKLTASELRELKRMLMPEGVRVIKAATPKTFYIVSPSHQGSLHTFYNAELATAKNQSPWSEQESKIIFKQIVRLVSYCHKIGIYFGDFRLQKLVYTDRKNSLIRFLHLRNIHVAPSLKDDTVQKSSSKCVPAYLAPEMMRFDKPFSATSADIWSLGILLFVLLTGRFPFYALRPSQLARMIRLCTWSFRPTDRLKRSARLLVYGLIRQNPQERPSAKEILMCDWLQSQVSEPLQSVCILNQQRPNVTVQLTVPEAGRLNEANPRIPHQLLNVLLQGPEERNNIYSSRTNIRASMESFAAALNRSMNGPLGDGADQVVPEQSVPVPSNGNCERDLLGITVVRVHRRNVGAAR